MKLFYLLLMIFIAASCAKDHWFDPPDTLPDYSCKSNLISQHIKIAVVSDIHYMDPRIAPHDPVNNTYWQEYVSHDRKIFELSDPIFRKVVSDLMVEKPDILLITGDLASEGELLCHETVKGFLQKLEKKGIKVFIVPGNNDINNPGTKTYKTDPPSVIPNITADDFKSIYEDFGFDEAIYRDENSLSYICQPYKGLWILGIDANEITSSGRHAIKAATMDWILGKMTEARENGITLLAMMHYGIIEHYSGQDKQEPLIKNSQGNAIALMNAGLRLIFTGHYHASDIVDFTNEGKTLTDIQTGSLVTPPYSYRIMKLEDDFLKIETRRVTDVRSEIPGHSGHISFQKYSGEIFTSRINSFFMYYKSFLESIYKIPDEQYPLAVPFFTKAYKAYFVGDERLDPAEATKIDALGQRVPSALPFLNSLWTDLPPKDNKLYIKLK
jgi:predicted MPP superfamily phosphohydrolase